jgi:hypothetical protein
MLGVFQNLLTLLVLINLQIKFSDFLYPRRLKKRFKTKKHGCSHRVGGGRLNALNVARLCPLSFVVMVGWKQGRERWEVKS